MASVITTIGYKTYLFLPLWEGLSITPKKRYKEKLCTFFHESPLAGLELDFSRDTSPVREDMLG